MKINRRQFHRIFIGFAWIEFQSCGADTLLSTIYVIPRNGHRTNRGTDEQTIEYDICIEYHTSSRIPTPKSHASNEIIPSILLFLQYGISIASTLNLHDNVQFIVGDGATTAIRCCITCVYSLSISIAKQKKWKQKLKTTVVCCHLYRMPYITIYTWTTADTRRPCSLFYFSNGKTEKMKRNNHQCAVLTTSYEF